MKLDYDYLTTGGLAEAFATRDQPDLYSTWSPVLAQRTVCLTMLAGSGSRWVASLEESQAAGKNAGVDPAAPRGLYPVPNAMGWGPDPVPIAGYALAAVRDLGRHVIVVRGWEREITERILKPLGYAPGSWVFMTQDAPGGKPRGHGDAAYQSMPSWVDSDYVLVNFGGDASSPLTALASLCVMATLTEELGDDAPDLLMPAAFAKEPAYPIAVDAQGLPRRFGHAKLSGSHNAALDTTVASQGGWAYTNVGVRLYRASALRDAILRIRSAYWTAEHGYAIPGNDPDGGEFALDNVDAMFASEGRARLLAVARPEELSPVKSVADLQRFGRDIKVVCGDWPVAASYSNKGFGLEKK